MGKVEKGQMGYLKTQKIKYLIGTIGEFSLVILLVIIGYVQTKTRLNWFTVFAILGCLPSAKMLVELITLAPHHGIAPDLYYEIEEKASLPIKLYDLVITGKDKVMPVDVIVISDHVVCGYTSSSRTDETVCAEYLKNLLGKKHYEKMTVKIFHDYHAFLTRAEGLHNMAEVGGQNNSKREQAIKAIILSTAM